MIIFHRPWLAARVLSVLVVMNWFVFSIYPYIQDMSLLGRVVILNIVMIVTYYAIMRWAIKLKATPILVPRDYTLAELTQPGVIYKEPINPSRIAMDA